MSIKEGDKVWIKTDVETPLGPAIEPFVADKVLVESPGVKVIHRMSNVLPDHPALPAVARWLAGLPEWLDAGELASALETVLVMSKEGQAMTCYDAVPVLYERQGSFVEASDNIKPHGWEALESLIAALTEATR